MWIIYRKELLELVRDRKALIFTILLPTVVLPVMVILITYFIVTIVQEAQEEVLPYAIFGQEQAPVLIEKFRKDDFFEEVELLSKESIPKAIKDNKIKFALVFEEGFLNHIRNKEQANLQLHFNDSSTTNRVGARAKKLIEDFNKETQKNILGSLDLSEEKEKGILEPITVEVVNVAEKREDWGEKFGGILPYLLLILCLTGAMYPAIDLGAGEKERGTLETLLLTPVERVHMVFAKFLVIFTTGISAAVLSMTSFAVWFILFGQAIAVGIIANIISSIGLMDLFLIFLMLVPTTAIFASLLLSISIYATSFKEAQNYMGPLTLFMAVPTMLSIVPGVQLTWGWAVVPITNISLAMKELVKGTIDYKMLYVILVSTTLIAALLLNFCTRWFNKEKVLFRT